MEKTLDDIVERLREWVAESRYRGNHDLHDVLEMAADEIEMLRRVEIEAAEWVEERTKRLRAENARLRAALRVLADADTYMRHLAEWHDTGHMAAGVQAFARAALGQE